MAKDEMEDITQDMIDEEIQKEEETTGIKKTFEQEAKAVDKKNEEKTENKKFTGTTKTIIAITAVLVLGIIIAVFLYNNFGKTNATGNAINPNDITYNGFVFKNTEPLWITRVQSKGKTYDVPFRHNPYEVENITVEGQRGFYEQEANKKKYTFLTLDDWDVKNGDLSMSVNEISKLFDQLIKIQVIAGCTNKSIGGSCDSYNMTEITCNNTNDPVIYLKLDNETKIVYDRNCITVQGQGEEITKASDKLLYMWLGIIKQGKNATNETQNLENITQIIDNNSTLFTINQSS